MPPAVMRARSVYNIKEFSDFKACADKTTTATPQGDNKRESLYSNAASFQLSRTKSSQSIHTAPHKFSTM